MLYASHVSQAQKYLFNFFSVELWIYATVQIFNILCDSLSHWDLMKIEFYNDTLAIFWAKIQFVLEIFILDHRAAKEATLKWKFAKSLKSNHPTLIMYSVNLEEEG